MQGRITERHLPQAEKCFPGISRYYDAMEEKPLTFLQLVWAYQGSKAAPSRRTKRARPRRRA